MDAEPDAGQSTPAGGPVAATTLTRSPVRAGVEVQVPEASLVSRSTVLADVRAGTAVVEVVTLSDGVPEGEPVAQHISGDVLRLLVPSDDGPVWMAVEGTDVWSTGLAVLLWLDGLGTDGDGLDRRAVVEAAPDGLRDVVARSLDEVGWQDESYRATVLRSLREPGRLALTVDLGPERGLAQDAMRISVEAVSDPGASVPPPPASGAPTDVDTFVRALVHDWPDGLTLRPWSWPDES